MQIQILRDDAARQLLATDEFSAEWERLYRDCPWATVFQSPAFARTWYASYRPAYRPLVVLARGDGGRLRGLLTLAQTVGGGRQLVAAGAGQAEYHTWLSAPEDGDDFPLAAFDALGRQLAGATLRLMYTAPGAPSAWLDRRGPRAFRVARRSERRPLIHLRDLTSVEALLKGEYYRRRQNWLRRNGGEIRIERITDPAAFDALLEEIAPLVDLRQGARYNHLAFHDDPLKAPFYRALMRERGVLEVSVLRAGDRIASVHVDGNNRGELEIGVLTHAPSLSRGSPGALHTLYLARELARDGWRAIDLTPGDRYKDELANGWDEVGVLHVFFSGRAHAVHVASMGARAVAKRLLARAGGSTERARERLDALSAAVRAPRRTARAVAHYLWSTDTVRLFAADADAARAPVGSAHDDTLGRDDVRALVAYAPRGAMDAPRQEWMSSALRRLEGGQVALTRMLGDALIAVGWVATGERPVSLAGYDQPVTLSPGTALLHDVRIDFGRLNGQAEGILRTMIAEAAATASTRRVVVAIPGGATPLAHALERLGLRRAGELVRTSRFGRLRPGPGSPPEDVTPVTPATPAAPAAPVAGA